MQDGTSTTSSGMKSGSCSVKIKNGVSTNVLSKSNHTHGGGIHRIHAHDRSRIRLEFNLRKASFSCMGLFERKGFSK